MFFFFKGLLCSHRNWWSSPLHRLPRPLTQVISKKNISFFWHFWPTSQATWSSVSGKKERRKPWHADLGRCNQHVETFPGNKEPYRREQNNWGDRICWKRVQRTVLEQHVSDKWSCPGDHDRRQHQHSYPAWKTNCHVSRGRWVPGNFLFFSSSDYFNFKEIVPRTKSFRWTRPIW